MSDLENQVSDYKKAVEQRRSVESARKKADTVGARVWAKDLYEQALATSDRAGEHYESGKIKEADALFKKAASEFQNAEKEATTARDTHLIDLLAKGEAAKKDAKWEELKRISSAIIAMEENHPDAGLWYKLAVNELSMGILKIQIDCRNGKEYEYIVGNVEIQINSGDWRKVAAFPYSEKLKSGKVTLNVRGKGIESRSGISIDLLAGKTKEYYYRIYRSHYHHPLRCYC